MEASGAVLLKEGKLYKRQRGRHGPSFRGLKFQSRLCSLTASTLEYFEPRKKVSKGLFLVNRIKMVEKVPMRTFHKDNCFQIGDEGEVMYLIAKTSKERDEWMEAIRSATVEKGNRMLSHYHIGAFGLSQKGYWSCCSKPRQESPGCSPVIGHPISEVRAYSTGGPSLEDVFPTRVSSASVAVHNGAGRGENVVGGNATDDDSRGPSPIYVRPPEELEGPRGSLCTQDRVMARSLPLLESSLSEQDVFTGAGPRPDSICPGNFDLKSVQKMTSLFRALENDDYKEVHDQLKEGADPNQFDGLQRTTMLHMACRRGSTQVVELLLTHGANAGLSDIRGNAPLAEACRIGYLPTVEVLVNSGAEISQEGENERTPLHEAAEAGHANIVKWLIKRGADTVARDNNDNTPYDLAFQKGWKQIMQLLQEAMPEGVRPYTIVSSHPIPEPLTAIALCGNHYLAGGSKDNHVRLWHIPDFMLVSEITIPNTTVSVDSWDDFIAISSTSIQVFEYNVNLAPERWRTIVIADYEVLENPSLHFVAFGPNGLLVTASVEGVEVKAWHPPPTGSNIIRPPCVHTFHAGKEPGSICSLSVSANAENPMLAVGVQPGKQFNPVGSKMVHLFDLGETKREFKPIDTGHGGLSVTLHTMFSRNGEFLVVGCGTDLGVWEINSRSFLCMPTTGAPIAALCYSPSGDAEHLAVGLMNGEIKVYEVSSGVISPLFSLSKAEGLSAITCMTYSKDGKTFIAANQSGILLMWKAHTGILSHPRSSVLNGATDMC